MPQLPPLTYSRKGFQLPVNKTYIVDHVILEVYPTVGEKFHSTILSHSREWSKTFQLAPVGPYLPCIHSHLSQIPYEHHGCLCSSNTGVLGNIKHCALRVVCMAIQNKLHPVSGPNSYTTNIVYKVGAIPQPVHSY